MKKLIAMLLAVSTIMAFSIPAFAASPPQTEDKFSEITYEQAAGMSEQELSTRAIYTFKVNQNGVNIRSGPGTNYSSLGQMNRGDIVYVYLQNQGSDQRWAYCLCDTPNKGVKGYIYEMYLTEVL